MPSTTKATSRYVEGQLWLELRATAKEPVKGVTDVRISMWPREKVEVGTARPASVGAVGPGLRRSEVDCAVRPAQTQGDPCRLLRGVGAIGIGGRPLAQLAATLSNILGETVVDRTALAGNFDVSLTWTPEQMSPTIRVAPDGAAPAADGPSIFTAIREQLGLRLVSQRSAAEVLVVDRAQRPVEN